MANFRKLHRSLAPIMVLPIVLTLTTGSIYQILEVLDQDREFGWLMQWHKGHFGPLNLEKIYPFLNAAGLLFLAVTGITMWWTTRRRQRPRVDV